MGMTAGCTISVRAWEGNDIKINRRKGDDDQTTTETILGRYYCSRKGYWWCENCAEEIK